ncbi:MAG: hypothetical protein WBE68_23980, partial [Candidatus Nitrosopolaris sp.]
MPVHSCITTSCPKCKIPAFIPNLLYWISSLSQIQTAFVQDNKGSAVNGICHVMGQKENQTGIHPLHMEQIKT